MSYFTQEIALDKITHLKFLCVFMSIVSQSRWIVLRRQRPCCPSIYRSLTLTARRYALSQDDIDTTKRTRNVGIIAHIDAGKTTTTERMLYYSGYTRRIGDVDDGSTVTDFLPAERARGITIQSAAITFHWPPLPPASTTAGALKSASSGPTGSQSYTINLIDTPGHADFTFEVLRSLRILDGAVCILDGVAGVEAQTEKVWHQAQAYGIPKIIYINKLDRDGAAFGRCVMEIAAKLHVWPAVCQIPWFEQGETFVGVVDVVNLRAMRWTGGDGKAIQSMDLTTLKDLEPKLADETRKARISLVEILSEHDDVLIEQFFEADGDHLAVAASDIMASLKRCLQARAPLVPVFAGASFRNIGVQPILDAVSALLPDPGNTPDPQFKARHLSGGLRDLVAGKIALSTAPAVNSQKGASAKKANTAQVQKLECCALAFKVVNDAKRGVLVYVRVYHGSLTRNSLLYNTNLQISERVPRLLRAYASDMVDIESISAGQIGVITGLKHARTGDTLVYYAGASSKTGPPTPFNDLQLRPIDAPPPVFFASIEPNSLGEQQLVAEALALLLREDPSLHLVVDEESGQTHLSGMGELHLEIACDRLIHDLKANASVGKIEIGFRECITVAGGPEAALFDRDVAGRRGKAGCIATIEPLTDPAQAKDLVGFRDGNLVSVNFIRPEVDGEKRPLSTSMPSHLSPGLIRQAMQNGASAALARGPQHAFPIYGAHVCLTIDPSQDLYGADSTPAALASAARQATQGALRKAATRSPSQLMEPMMDAVISVDENSLGPVVHDLTSARGGQIVSLDEAETMPTEAQSKLRGDMKFIDLTRVYAPPDPFESSDGAAFDGLQGNGHRPRSITAKVPLREMVGYLKHLRSLTGGKGTFVMNVDKFERMNARREKAVLKELRGP